MQGAGHEPHFRSSGTPAPGNWRTMISQARKQARETGCRAILLYGARITVHRATGSYPQKRRASGRRVICLRRRSGPVNCWKMPCRHEGPLCEATALPSPGVKNKGRSIGTALTRQLPVTRAQALRRRISSAARPSRPSVAVAGSGTTSPRISVKMGDNWLKVLVPLAPVMTMESAGAPALS